MLGPSEYGVYSILMASAVFLGTAAALGWPALATREAARASAIDNAGALRGVTLVSLASVGIVGIGIALVATLVVTSGAGGMFASPHTGIFPVLAAGMLVPLTALSLVRAGLLRGLHKVIRADFPDLVLRPLVVVLLIAAVGLHGHGNKLSSMMAFQLIAATLALLVGLGLLAPTLSIRVLPVYPPRWLRAALPFWLIAEIGLLVSQAPLYLLGVLSNAAQAGLFSIAGQIAGTMALCVISIEMPLQARMAQAWARNDLEGLERLARSAARLGLSISATMAVALLFFPHAILSIVGSNYEPAAPALRILAIGQLLYAMSGPCRVVLSMSGNEKTVLVAAFGALLVTIAMAVALIPVAGAAGAALAVALGTGALNGTLQLVSWKRLRISTSPIFPPCR